MRSRVAMCRSPATRRARCPGIRSKHLRQRAGAQRQTHAPRALTSGAAKLVGVEGPTSNRSHRASTHRPRRGDTGCGHVERRERRRERRGARLSVAPTVNTCGKKPRVRRRIPLQSRVAGGRDERTPFVETPPRIAILDRSAGLVPLKRRLDPRQDSARQPDRDPVARG